MVFDSLSELRLLAQSSLRYRRQILALKQFFVGRTAPCCCSTTAPPKGRTCSCRASRTACSRSTTSAPPTAARAAAAGGEVPRQRLQQRLSRLQHPRGGLQVFPRLTAAEHVHRFEREHGRQRRGRARRAARRRHRPRHHHAARSGRRAPASRPSPCSTPRPRRARRPRGGLRVRGIEGHPAASARRAGHARAAKARGPGRSMVRQIDPAEISPGEFAHLVRAVGRARQARASS